MNEAVTLLFGVHAHQPVGNFPEVIEQAHLRCYRPFLHTLHDYPAFRCAVHLSGWLLDWLRARFPADMALLAGMVARGQVELFGSGDCEPVLAAIPERDRLGQLRAGNARLAAWSGAAPQGAWLTERVWDSAVVPALAAAGIRYAMVDDYHLLCCGKRADELDGYFSTEEGGVRLDLFPISEALRYRLPFAPAAEVVAYLEGLAANGQAAAIYFDDIEKFGIWPQTHEWVYARGWLRALFEGVLASSRIRSASYAEFHAARPSRGLVYPPSIAYREMNAWALPPPAAAEYAGLLAAEQAAGSLERHRPFLRGGIWRGFLSRYAEANWMHKRMLGLSARLAALPAPEPELTAALYRAQANDAYWHGLFGGLYLPHLRRAVWNNIVALEAALDALQARPALAGLDADLDGKTETFAHNDALQLVLRDDGLGALHELTSYRLRHNFGDTLRRYREHYHDKIGSGESRHDGEGIASAHDIVRFKHPVSVEDIVPDPLPRAVFLDELNGATITDYAADALQLRRAGIAKTYALGGDRLTVSWHLSGLAGQHFITRLNLAMPSCDGFLGRYMLADGSIPGGFGAPLQLAAADRLTLDDGVLGGKIALLASRPAEISAAPLKTVSQSEAGFEKIMQAVELCWAWEIPGDDCTLHLHLDITPQP